MVKTRTDLKLALKEWTTKQDSPFTTEDARQFAQEHAGGRIHVDIHRIAKYLRATGTPFDKTTRKWVKTHPETLK